MRILFKQDCYVQLWYTWHCGDGCCSGREDNGEYFHLGDTLEISYANNPDWLEIDYDTFPYLQNHPWNDRECQPITVTEWKLEELIEKGKVEVVG